MRRFSAALAAIIVVTSLTTGCVEEYSNAAPGDGPASGSVTDTLKTDANTGVEADSGIEAGSEITGALASNAASGLDTAVESSGSVDAYPAWSGEQPGRPSERLEAGPTATPTWYPTLAPNPTAPPTSTPDPFAAFGPPTRLEIPAIGVDAFIEQVGLTSERAMDVPKGWMNVGWYREGFYPGEVGNAVIAGHLDSVGGGPAVFWDLDKLVPGDEVRVTYENGDRYTFAVQSQQTYAHDAEGPIISSIFDQSLTPDLNLITCDGAWDRGQATYTQRLVVFTTLVPEKTVRAGTTDYYE